MDRIKCPVCSEEGTLQWKDTVTTIKEKTYRYRKLYVYHQHPSEHPNKPKWCYLNEEHRTALGLTQRDSLTQITQNNSQMKNLNLGSISENRWTGGDLNPRPPECKSGVHTN